MLDRWLSVVIDIGKAPRSVGTTQDICTVYKLIDASYKWLLFQPLVLDSCQARLSKSISSEHPKGTLIKQTGFGIDGRSEV